MQVFWNIFSKKIHLHQNGHKNSIQFAFFTAKEYLCDFVAGRQLRKRSPANTPPPAAPGLLSC